MSSTPPPTSLISRNLVLVSVTLFLGAQVPNMFVLAPGFLGARGYDEQQIGVVMGAFNLASLAGMLLVGALLARFGHARVIAAGSLVCACGALGFEATLALDAATAGFAAARALQGIGFAAVLVGTGAYVAESAPAHRLAQALGIAGVLTLCAQAVGPALGEAVVAGAGWSPMFVTAAASGVLAAAVALTLPPVVAHPAALDGDGKSPAPIVAATVLAAVGFGSIWSFISDYTEQVGIAGVTPFFVPYVIAAISTRVFLGRLPDRLGKRQVAVPALLLHGAALGGMAILGARWQLEVIGAVFGFAHGVYYPALMAMIVERGANRSRSITISSLAFGTGIVIAAYGLGPIARASGYETIYVLAGGASACAAGLVWTS